LRVEFILTIFSLTTTITEMDSLDDASSPAIMSMVPPTGKTVTVVEDNSFPSTGTCSKTPTAAQHQERTSNDRVHQQQQQQRDLSRLSCVPAPVIVPVFADLVEGRGDVKRNHQSQAGGSSIQGGLPTMRDFSRFDQQECGGRADGAELKGSRRGQGAGAGIPSADQLYPPPVPCHNNFAKVAAPAMMPMTRAAAAASVPTGTSAKCPFTATTLMQMLDEERRQSRALRQRVDAMEEELREMRCTPQVQSAPFVSSGDLTIVKTAIESLQQFNKTRRLLRDPHMRAFSTLQSVTVGVNVLRAFAVTQINEQDSEHADTWTKARDTLDETMDAWNDLYKMVGNIKFQQ
jgi:hypothetical protein